jgi:hypothetical protein
MSWAATFESSWYKGLLATPRNARDVGACIYCGATDEPLQREHAVPYGLNGTWTLRRASCAACANLTHRFERDALKGLWPSIRAVLAMRTRRQHSATLPLVIEKDGTQRTIQVLAGDYPLYLPLPIFPPPSAIASAALPDGAPSFEMRFLHIAGPSFETAAARYAADFVGARLTFSPREFGRMLAKIAFCAGVGALGLAPFKQTPIRRVILGDDLNISRWVGCWDGETLNDPQGLHAIQIRASGTDVHVVIRLFAQFGTPEYHVLLGPADADFVNSPAWPWT